MMRQRQSPTIRTPRPRGGAAAVRGREEQQDFPEDVLHDEEFPAIAPDEHSEVEPDWEGIALPREATGAFVPEEAELDDLREPEAELTETEEEARAPETEAENLVLLYLQEAGAIPLLTA